MTQTQTTSGRPRVLRVPLPREVDAREPSARRPLQVWGFVLEGLEDFGPVGFVEQ